LRLGTYILIQDLAPKKTGTDDQPRPAAGRRWCDRV